MNAQETYKELMRAARLEHGMYAQLKRRLDTPDVVTDMQRTIALRANKAKYRHRIRLNEFTDQPVLQRFPRRQEVKV